MTDLERKRIVNDLYSLKTSTSILYVTPEQAVTEFFKVNQWEYNIPNIIIL